ncbi:Tyrocidine synthase 3 [BD1-7 clade bacterium]|uniref:Tyrocidine synthase 3 n=1 Tax=BD1-7 clade bacterium TaxID=2029982 RepID=A0A5S9PGE2_9GAMM|nr:Tyrocidine synthase 3 [BD1-7 clade bacterium]CAA0102859.1 Tyrocidine synthase 3 [BD1-7 clade bacterium]
MNTSELQDFLRNLWLQGVELWLEGDQLRFRGSKSVMDSKTLAQLKAHKSAIIALIQARPEHYLGFPLSQGQQGIALMQAVDPESAAYNQVCCLTLQDDLNVDLLEKAFDFLLQRHAPLRMALRQLDGINAQQVSYSLPSILVVETASVPPVEDIDADRTNVDTTDENLRNSNPVHQWIEHHASVPFALDKEPLVRARLRIPATANGTAHLLIVAHHIVADFWTMELIISELQQIYQASLQQRSPDLPDIGKLYKDYVITERQWLNSEASEAAQQYWHQQLTPLPAPLDLPTDFPRPARQSFAGKEYHFTLPAPLTKALKTQAQQHQVTPFVWALTTFQTLLHLYTGQSTINVGSPVAGRTLSDYQKLAGHFTNPVNLVQHFDQDSHFADLLLTNKQTVLQGMKHQQYPMQRLIDELKSTSDTGFNPLFQVAMSWNQITDKQDNQGALIADIELMEQRGAIYDLVLTGIDAGDEVRLSVRYNTDIFKVERIERLVSHWQQLLAQTIETPMQKVCDIDLLSDADRALAGFSADSSDSASNASYDLELSLPAHFAKSVRLHGDKLAWRDARSNTTLTYSELDHAANQLGQVLVAEGVKATKRVALLAERGATALQSVLAILKIGAVVVPIDPAYPRERIQQMLELAKCRLIINATEKALDVDTNTTALLDWNTVSQRCAEHDSASLQTAQSAPAETACVLFTSGSTGIPKGVEIPHRAIARLALNNGFLALEPGQSIGYAANIAFDATHIEVWNALLNGATLLQIHADTLLDIPAFRSFLQQQKPDALFLTTALFHLCTANDPSMFSNIQTLMTGGEAIDAELVKRCFTHGRPGALYNLYGPTENGTVSTACHITESDLESSTLPIGRAINHSQAYILNQWGRPAPIGIIGEIIVSGDGLANGYLHRSDLTAQAFSPKVDDAHSRQYATGDLGYLREDGQIIYAGRRDDQVKIRGFRIELGEIEHQLNSLRGINNACALPLKDEAGQVFVAAYVSTGADTTNTSSVKSDEIRRQLRQKLPDYMVPAAIMVLDVLPINANGKIDKKRLPPVTIERHGTFVAAATTEEKTIAAIWQSLLNIKDIGIHDNFFELGGHSLLAVNAANQMQEALGLPINMRDIFTQPTIADLLASLHGQNAEPQLPPILQRQDDQPIPASMAQQRLWFVQQLAPDSCAYNMPVAVRIHQPLRLRALESALKQLIERHQVLHTRFRDDSGVAYLDITDVSQWTLPQLDLSRLAPQQAEQEATNQLQLMANQPFDLARDLPIRAITISLAPDQHILALCLHHIAVDGSSVAMLIEELGHLWRAEETGIPAALPTVTVDYADFSLWQRQWLQGERLQQQLAYWQQQLSDASPMLDLPTDKPRPPQLSNHGATLTFPLPESLVTSLNTLSKDQGVTLFMTLISAYTLLLARYSQQSDICVGFPITGKNHPQLQSMAGLFVNNLVLRTQLASNPTVRQLLTTVKQSTIDAYAHQDAPFDTLIDSLGVERSLSFTPFLQASFALEPLPLEARLQSALGESISHQPLDWQMAKYDVNLTCFEDKTGMQAQLEYSTDLFEQTTIERMARHFVNILDAMVAQPETPVNQLRMVTTEEQQMLLAAAADHSLSAISVIEQFEANAERYSDKTAVNDDIRQASYRHLNTRANQIADYLVQHNIGRGDFVGISLPRSVDLIASIIGVLKSGAAYVPLDPSMPEERQRFIIEDAGIAILLTESSQEANDIPCGIFALESLPAATAIDTAYANPGIHLPLDSTAYVIYTSGTTGKPKGCLVTHQNLSRLFTSTEDTFHFDADQVWSLFHSYAFDFSVWEIWGALLYGARLAIVPQWITRSTDAFFRFVAEQQVTVLNQTPSAFTQFIMQDQLARDAIQTGSDTSEEIPSLALNTVIFGGEALDFNALTRWASHYPLNQIRLVNMYGITETTVHVTHHTISDTDLQRGRSVIGQPLNDLKVHLLDSHGQLVPIGVMGEMYISGAGVSDGYLNRPELTANRFVNNPFANELSTALAKQHQRMYRSGDLARRLPNGDIEYLGRIDHQVKIRGYRIELGEVEAVLSSLEQIKDSVVLAREDEPGNKRLVAYLLTGEKHTLDGQQLRQQLKAALPEYMIPAAFIFMSSWPLTHNGKVDPVQLPRPAADDFLSSEFIAPENETETAIAGIWQDILGIERVGIHDNFFELGGHSLLATQVASRIRTQFECQLELKAIFEHPTVAELAMLILEQEIASHSLDDDELLAMLEDLDDLEE